MREERAGQHRANKSTLRGTRDEHEGKARVLALLAHHHHKTAIRQSGETPNVGRHTADRRRGSLLMKIKSNLSEGGCVVVWRWHRHFALEEHLTPRGAISYCTDVYRAPRSENRRD